MERARLPRILCVDDEPQVLTGLRRALRRTYDVSVALGAAMAIEEINAQEPFEVVVSDLHMPGMDGIEFLRWVSGHTPDTSGILLTGNANLGAAIAAVNAGFIFRFMTKPCPQSDLTDAIAAGCKRYAAKCAERILLGQAVDRDAVTGLPDRRRFAADVARLQGHDPGMALALIVLAIDDLDLIKRTLGHAAADQAIVASARRLQASLREPRLQLGHAVLFRIDDRLAVLWCEQATSPADLVAAHLLKVMETDVSLAGQLVRLAGRAGIAALGAEPVGSTAHEDPFVVLRNAEDACLAASASRSLRIAHFSASVHAREQRRLRLLQGLRSPQFVTNLSCVFQPQWSLTENRLIGLEALARWRDPELGSVSPAEFVPLAEEDPEIANRLADWMVMTACRQRREWRSLISDEVRVGVNFSATQLQAGALHERIRSALESVSLLPSLFEVEITESAAIADFAHSTAELLELRRQGVGVAIDDFGVGFSSLSYLAELPATCLKIDRAFLQGIEDHQPRIDLLRGICSLGHAMHMSVIVEGVESLRIAAWLRTVGCDAVQGFAIARPMLADAFSQWYERESPSIATALADAEIGHPESRATG
jgi:predicted signal transduction protein with EAL and GGDEF domain